jgi:hypothetical protein
MGFDFLRDHEIPVPPGEERGEMGKFTSLFCCCFFCETYVIFMLLLLYIIFLYHIFLRICFYCVQMWD